MNYRLIATEVGDLVKWDSSLNSIDRAAGAIFSFQREEFPNTAITSSRAQRVYDWILSLAKQFMEQDRRDILLIQFCRSIVPESSWEKASKRIENSGVSINGSNNKELADFMSHGYHTEIHKHCRQLFMDGHYVDAVFEACKVYNRLVQEKARSARDGQALMLEVWGPDGVLKITKCQTDTDRNVQHGVKFLSAGLMQAVRNPTSHEPALDWPIKKQDCLDLLGFISFLFRQIDSAVYYKT